MRGPALTEDERRHRAELERTSRVARAARRGSRIEPPVAARRDPGGCSVDRRARERHAAARQPDARQGRLRGGGLRHARRRQQPRAARSSSAACRSSSRSRRGTQRARRPVAARSTPPARRSGARSALELRRRVVAGHSLDSWADAVTAVVARQSRGVGSCPWRSTPSEPALGPAHDRATSARRGRMFSRGAGLRTFARRTSGSRAGGARRGRARARPLRGARPPQRRLRRHDLLEPALARGARRMAPVPAADHVARLLAGRSLRAARAAGRDRPGRLVARARRRDHARVRLRHGLRLHDVRARPDSVRHVRAVHRRCSGRPTTRSRSSCGGVLGARTRVLLVGEGNEPRLAAAGADRSRGALAYEFVGTFVPRSGEGLADRIERETGRTR